MPKSLLFRCIVLLVFGMLFTSCATLFGNSLTTVNAHTKIPSKVIYQNDTLQTTNNRVTIFPKRSKEPLKLQIINDSITKDITVDSRNSALFYSNIFNYGIGFIWDWNNPNRYTYPGNITIENDGRIRKASVREPKKGNIDLCLSVPYINGLSLQPVDEGTKSSSGFYGLAIGLDYHYSERQFLNLTIGNARDFPFPIPAAVDYEGNYEVFSSTYISITNNHAFNRFSLGYGLSLNRNVWDLKQGLGNIEPDWRPAVRKANSSLGLSLASAYRLGKSFHLGLTYKPAFVSLSSDKPSLYEHTISLELQWKIKL